MLTECIICAAPLPPKKRPGGDARRFCSGACKQRNAHYKRTGKHRAEPKACSGCGVLFSITSERNPDGKLKRSDTKWCNICRPSSGHPMSAMTKRLFYRYGLTLEEYERAADIGCEICGQTAEKLHVDHDHDCCPSGYTCGKCVRGFLCGACNRAIGLLREDADLMLSAAAYVLQSRNVLGGAPSQR